MQLNAINVDIEFCIRKEELIKFNQCNMKLYEC
jgi:hypothetical protein